METTLYAVMYFGNAKRYQDLNYEIEAFTKREAVEKFYEKMRNEDYFPEDEFVYGGYVFDCDKNLIAYPGGEQIEYDGGYFYAEPVIE
jgi:hypothetical protein